MPCPRNGAPPCHSSRTISPHKQLPTFSTRLIFVAILVAIMLPYISAHGCPPQSTVTRTRTVTNFAQTCPTRRTVTRMRTVIATGKRIAGDFRYADTGESGAGTAGGLAAVTLTQTQDAAGSAPGATVTVEQTVTETAVVTQTTTELAEATVTVEEGLGDGQISEGYAESGTDGMDDMDHGMNIEASPRATGTIAKPGGSTEEVAGGRGAGIEGQQDVSGQEGGEEGTPPKPTPVPLPSAPTPSVTTIYTDVTITVDPEAGLDAPLVETGADPLPSKNIETASVTDDGGAEGISVAGGGGQDTSEEAAETSPGAMPSPGAATVVPTPTITGDDTLEDTSSTGGMPSVGGGPSSTDTTAEHGHDSPDGKAGSEGNLTATTDGPFATVHCTGPDSWPVIGSSGGSGASNALLAGAMHLNQSDEETTSTDPGEGASSTDADAEGTTTAANAEGTSPVAGEDATSTAADEGANVTEGGAKSFSTKASEEATSTTDDAEATSTATGEEESCPATDDEPTSTANDEDATSTTIDEDATSTTTDEEGSSTKTSGADQTATASGGMTM